MATAACRAGRSRSLDAAGTVVGRTTTAADGSYRVPDLLPGVPLTVRFRDPASAVVFGYPVNGDTAPGASGATCTPGGGLSSCVGSGATPALSVVLAAGQDLPQQSLPVDPSGVVYDAGTRAPVPGAVVTLAPSGTCAGWAPASHIVGATLGGYTINGDAISMTVGADGFYQYLIAPSAPASCTFALTVTPPAGYTFVSTAIPPTAGPLVPTGGPGSVFEVQPQAGAPTAPPGTGTTYYLTVTSGSAGANIVHNHIPLDPLLPTGVVLTKTGDKTARRGRRHGALQRSRCRSPAGRCRARRRWSTGCRPASPSCRAPRWSTTCRSPTRPAASGRRWPSTSGRWPAMRRMVLRYRVRVGVGCAAGRRHQPGHRAMPAACPPAASAAGFAPLARRGDDQRGRATRSR